MSSPTALDLKKAGRLKDAIAAATDVVRNKPTDVGARSLLCELLCFAGELDRADRQAEALSSQDPQSAVHVAMFRHLLRAEQARQKFFSEGAVPDFLEPPNERLQFVLKASIAVREKKPGEALALLREAFNLFPTLKGRVSPAVSPGLTDQEDEPFEGLRDDDDLLSTVFELLAPNGKYYWVPMEKVQMIEFRPHQGLRDLLWRRARIVMHGGHDTEIYMPAIYAGSHQEKDENLPLGHLTDYRTEEGGPTRAVGQRQLILGETERPFLGLGKLTISEQSPEVT